MRIVIYTGGIKGVGKTTLLSKLLAHPSVINLEYKRVKIAEKMFRILQERGLIKEYEELQTIDVEIQKEVRAEAFKEAFKEQGNLIFDGHYAISSPYGYSFGIPVEIIKEIDCYVLLYNSPKVIERRRREDTSKKRELDLSKIKLDLKVEEAFASFYANITGKTLIKIKTDNKTLDKMIKILNEVRKNG